MTYRFLSPAQRELAEAIAYYDRAVPGLGLEFLEEVERTVSRIPCLGGLPLTRFLRDHTRTA